jgi:large subunit ribosomal protein L46
MIKAGKIEVELDSDARNLQTAQDFEDSNQDELSKIEFASRETEDDKKNNLKSLNRKLDDTLMLMIEHNIESKKVMLLPQTKWNEGETLRQTAERIIQEKMGPELKVQLYGNAPCGFYKYKYANKKNEAVGSKVFFYRAAYRSGQVADQNTKYEWLNEEEFKNSVRPSYYNSVSQFLVS